MVTSIKWIPARRGFIYHLLSALSQASFILQDCGSMRARLLALYKISSFWRGD